MKAAEPPQQTLVDQAFTLLAIARARIERFVLVLLVRSLHEIAGNYSDATFINWVCRFMRAEAIVARATQTAARRIAGLPPLSLPLSHYMPARPRSVASILRRWYHLCFRIDGSQNMALRMAEKIKRAAERAALPVAVALAGEPEREPDGGYAVLAMLAVVICQHTGVAGPRAPP
jgi:hypothetical protein